MHMKIAATLFRPQFINIHKKSDIVTKQVKNSDTDPKYTT